MRTTSAGLQTASRSLSRIPIVRATVRDVRLRFSLFAHYTNPWGITLDNAPYENDKHVYGAQLVTSLGTFVRFWKGATGNLYLSGGPTTSTWGTWYDMGWAADAGSNPSLSETGGTLYLHYVRSGTVRYRSCLVSNMAWSGESSLGVTVPAKTKLAAFGSEVWACTVENKAIVIYRLTGGVKTAMYRLYGNSKDAIVYPEYNSTTYFDVFQVGGKTWIVFCFGDQGKTWIASYTNGTFGDPQLLLPDDYSNFVPYGATVIQGKAYLTGRLTRINDPAYSPSLDVYLTSLDGEHWTIPGSRDSFLTANEIRGKMHLVGSSAYYIGIYSVYSAPSTYAIDPAGDPAALKLDVTDDVLTAGVSFPSTGTAPSGSMELANANNAYLTSDIAKPGSEVHLEFGYRYNGVSNYASLFRGVIDARPTAISDGERSASYTLRDRQFNALKGMQSLFAWPLKSKLKNFDPCELMDGLYQINSSTWSTKSSNLLANGGFETGVAGWSNYATGGATGSRSVATDLLYEGDHAYKIIKTGGALGDYYGIVSDAISVEAGKSYTVTVPIAIDTVYTGSPLIVEAKIAGNWGTAGAPVTVSDTLTTALGSYSSIVLTFTAEVSATATITIYFKSVATGTFWVDGVELVQDSVGYLSYTALDKPGILYATSPVSARDVDLRTTFSVSASVPSINTAAGLLVYGDDLAHNYIALVVQPGLGNIALFKMREGTRTNLTTQAYAFNYGVNYNLWLRVEGGHFLGYIKTTAQLIWVKVIDHIFDATNDLLCPTDDGEGHVGLYASIKPPSFSIYPMDSICRVVGVRPEGVGDFESFPSSGEVLIDSERMKFGSRSALAAVVPLSGKGFLWATELHGNVEWFTDNTNYNDGDHSRWIQGDAPYFSVYYKDYPALANNNVDWQRGVLGFGDYGHGAPTYGARGLVEVTPIGAPFNTTADVAKDKVLIFTDELALGCGWRIRASMPHWAYYHPEYIGYAYMGGYGGYPGSPDPPTQYLAPTLPNPANSICGLMVSGEGYGPATNSAGTPNWVVYAGGNAAQECVITGGLHLTERASYGTEAAVHGDFSTCYQYANDVVRFHDFLAQDFVYDLNTEQMLELACGMVGVQTEFDATFASAANWNPTAFGSDLFPGLNQKNFDIEFDIAAPGVPNCSRGIIFRNSDGAPGTLAGDGTVVCLRFLAGTITAQFFGLGSAYALNVETPLPVTLDTSQAIHVRLVVNEYLRTLYVNGVYVFSAWSDLDLATTHAYLGVYAVGTGPAITNIRIPELYEWRDAIYFDNGSSVDNLLGDIIGDRPIKFLSRNGSTTLKFGLLETRADLNTVNGSVPYSDLIYGDNTELTETEVFTFAHIYADKVAEMYDTDLMQEYGFISKDLRMPKASIELAAKMVLRMFRQVKETLEGRSLDMPANFAFEPEDKFSIAYTTTGAAYVQAEKVLIVESVDFSFSPADLSMSVNSRRYVA